MTREQVPFRQRRHPATVTPSCAVPRTSTVPRPSASTSGAASRSSASGSVVRTTPSGQPVLCDGPYTETTEQLGGYYLVRTTDPDALLRLAARLVEAEGRGTVEVRGMARGPREGTAVESAPARAS